MATKPLTYFAQQGDFYETQYIENTICCHISARNIPGYSPGGKRSRLLFAVGYLVSGGPHFSNAEQLDSDSSSTTCGQSDPNTDKGSTTRGQSDPNTDTRPTAC